MVAFRRKRKRSRRAKGRTRRTVRRANPKRRRKRARARRSASVGAHRPRLTFKSGKWYGGKSPRSLIKRGSGTRVNRRRRRRRRNPNGIRGVQRMFTQRMLVNTATAGAGIAIGFTAMPIFYRVLPQTLKAQRRWLGGIHLALGLGIAGFVRNRMVKDIGLVIAATGVYDLIAMNVEFLGLPPLRTTSPLADRLIPSPAAAAAQQAMGGRLRAYGASYPVSAAPVSPVAATGVGASFEKFGASYPSLAYPSVGLSDDLEMSDMVN